MAISLNFEPLLAASRVWAAAGVLTLLVGCATLAAYTDDHWHNGKVEDVVAAGVSPDADLSCWPGQDTSASSTVVVRYGPVRFRRRKAFAVPMEWQLKVGDAVRVKPDACLIRNAAISAATAPGT